MYNIYNEDPHQRAQKLSLTRNVRLLEAPAAFFPKDLPHGSVKISPSSTAMYVHTLYIIYIIIALMHIVLYPHTKIKVLTNQVMHGSLFVHVYVCTSIVAADDWQARLCRLQSSL